MSNFAGGLMRRIGPWLPEHRVGQENLRAAFPEKSKSGVLARTEESIHSAKDLIGKKVGVPGINGLLDVVFRQWLAKQGIDTKKLTYVEASFPQMSDMLRSGTVVTPIRCSALSSERISLETPASSGPSTMTIGRSNCVRSCVISCA